MTAIEKQPDDHFRTFPNPFRKGPAPMACCPKDGEPLVSTLKFRGAEFICVVCRQTYGFLAPVPKDVTPKLEERQAELKARYDAGFEV